VGPGVDEPSEATEPDSGPTIVADTRTVSFLHEL
jgi:hypothetical protein